MNKKLISLILILAVVFSSGCSSSQKQSSSEDNLQETYLQHETVFGMSYEIPDSWKVADFNTDFEIFHYKNEIGTGDDMLYMGYQELNDDITTEESFNEFTEGLLDDDSNPRTFQAEDFETNNIKMKKFSYNTKIENKNYKSQGVVFNCCEGIVTMLFFSLPSNNYDTYFDKIISSIKTTDAIEDEIDGNNVENENNVESIDNNPSDELENESERVQNLKTTDDVPETFSMLHGTLIDANPKGGTDGKTLVIKTKIESSATNNLTIKQNYFNIADIIHNQGGNEFNCIDYWAVADMTSGDEEKVVAFTLSKEVINMVYENQIADNQIGEYADDLFIHPSLQ